MIKQVKDQIGQNKELLKILKCEELENIVKTLSDIDNNIRIGTDVYPASVSLWFDSVRSEILPILLRTAARNGWRNRNKTFRIDLNDLLNETNNMAWYLENEEKKDIKINLLVPSRFTNCEKIIVGHKTLEIAKIPIYEIRCN